MLPENTPINLNTAMAEVLAAGVPELSIGTARQAIDLRRRNPWSSLDDARQALGPAGRFLDEKQHSIQSRYFEVMGRMRIENVVQQERVLLQRDGRQVRMLWRLKSPQQLTSAPLQ